MYLLLNDKNLCGYYRIEANPGIQAKGKFVHERFGYLDDPSIAAQLLQFNNGTQAHVQFSLPQIHCASCVFLLEHLHQINPGIIRSQTNFQRKEIFISFQPQVISLRQVVELLAFIGYEPTITLEQTTTSDSPNRSSLLHPTLIKIGVAGFCFANIMMLSFPEYFSGGHIEQAGLKKTFTGLIAVLSLPVLFYSASTFYLSAWKSLRQRFLNIDAPIVLATIVAFGRSYYEIITGTGAGYLDSATGIIFFMLVGRWFQSKTYDSLSFDRDYRSYFPLGVTLIKDKEQHTISLTQLNIGDRILTRNEEMVPADALLLKGKAMIDYSFVSGENHPVAVEKGSLIFAGGKQVGGSIELEVVKPVQQSYITDLWNRAAEGKQKNNRTSFIHPWSRYFSLVQFSVALVTAIYWWVVAPQNVWPAVTAILLVACPCSLLLSATFTFGNMLRIFGRNKFFLKNASVIESLSNTDTIVFDKTGTLTSQQSATITYEGTPLTAKESALVHAMCKQSVHPMSKIVATHLNAYAPSNINFDYFEEVAGKGLEARCGIYHIRLGSPQFVEGGHFEKSLGNNSQMLVAFNGICMGSFHIQHPYRPHLQPMIHQLKAAGYGLHVLSGDNDAERSNLEMLFGKTTPIHFQQTPLQKLEYIRSLQENGHRVCMIGDGLNDAGALLQADTGIAVSSDTARFSPASDALLHGDQVASLQHLMQYAKSGKRIVTASFVLSILYNFVGVGFAVQAKLSPMIAAILMPLSSISIVVLVSVLSTVLARKYKL